MVNLALLILRVTVGTLMAGHGAQKLFGWFGGPGMKGTKGMMDQLGIKPGHVWGPTAAFGEFSGGVLTLLGFLSPLGPQNIASSMVVASHRVHWSKGIWNSNGGIEFPATNLTVALALALAGPGKYSLDSALGIRMPKWAVALTWINFLAITGTALFRPETVQTALDRAMGASQAYTEPSPDQAARSDLEVEQRPIPSTQSQTAPVGH